MSEGKEPPARKLVRPGMPPSRPVISNGSSVPQTNGASAGKDGSSSSETLLKRLSSSIPSPSAPIRAGRLASFKQERDLTLGGARPSPPAPQKPKKVFAPTIPARREKNKEAEKTPETSNNFRKGERGGRHGERFQDGGRGRGRGRGRGQPEVIQVQGGVFAEGVGEGSVRRFQSKSGPRDENTPSAMAKPTLNLSNMRIDKAEEDRALSKLMRDDFLDDGHDHEDLQFAPIQLPKIEAAKLLKEEVAEMPKIKADEIVGGVKIKQEKMDDAPQAAAVVDGQEVPGVEVAVKREYPTEVAELFSSHNPELVLFQLPATMPGLKADKEKPKVIKPEAGTTTAEAAVKEKDEEESCTLKTLPEGKLGTLQVLRSGKVRMKLGDHIFEVATGTPLSFLEELVTVQLDEGSRSGEMTNLGTIRHHVICSPEWTSLLAESFK